MDWIYDYMVWSDNEGRSMQNLLWGIAVGMQNAAQAIAVATSPLIFNSVEMAIPAIIYSLLMNVILLGYLKIFCRD